MNPSRCLTWMPSARRPLTRLLISRLQLRRIRVQSAGLLQPSPHCTPTSAPENEPLRTTVATGMVRTIAAPGTLGVAEMTDAVTITDVKVTVTDAAATFVRVPLPAPTATIASLTDGGLITRRMSARPRAETTRTGLLVTTRWADRIQTKTTGPSRDERGAVRDRVDYLN